MSSSERITDSLEYAKEISSEIDSSPEANDTKAIVAAVHLMNQRLWSSGGNVLSTFKADEAYLDVPDMRLGVERVSHDSLQRSRIENPVIQGLVDSFRWVGTAGLSSFGLQVYEAQVLDESHLYLKNEQKVVKPVPPTKSQSAFIPIDAINTRIKPFGSLLSHRYIMTDDGEIHGLIASRIPLQIHKDFTILKSDDVAN